MGGGAFPTQGLFRGVISSFALVATALELAPKELDIDSSVCWAVKAWVNQRGGVGLDIEQHAYEMARPWLGQNEARFQRDNIIPPNKAGYKKIETNDKGEILERIFISLPNGF